MSQFFDKTKTVFLFLSILTFQFGYSQNLDQTQDKTVILKVKEEFRSECSLSKIALPQFNLVMAEIGSSQLIKIFPNKKQEAVKGNVDLSLIYELNYTNSFSVKEVISKIRKLRITEYIEPYYIPELAYTPSDTIFPNQYCMNLIQAENAWDVTQGDTNYVIGITDTGWDTTHLDLIGKVKLNYADPINGLDDDNDGYVDNYKGWDLGMEDNNAHYEANSHGVSVSGLAAAGTDNIIGIAGAGFKAKFLPVKISNSAGLLTRAYQGIVYAADHGCFVINCSWGSYVPSQFGQNVIDYATINKGCLVVGAAGNDDDETVFYPAGYDGVLTVASSNQTDTKANFSNYGHYIDISAPGKTLRLLGGNNTYTFNSGTSFSAPLVSGGAALMKAQFPSYNNYQIAALIEATADDLNANNPTYIDKLGSGRLNLFNGVSATAIQFLDLTDHTETDNNNDIFETGDTVRIEGLFQNYLDPISGVTVTVTSSSPYVNVLDGTTTLPALGTMDTVTNNSDNFTAQILSGAGLNEVLLFKAVITNGTFTKIEYFTIILNPDFINLAENQVATTITSNGKIGLNDNSLGLGFSYNGEPLLFEAGLMIGDDATRVADVVRGASGADNDFLSYQNVGFNPPYISALDLYGNMNDSPLTNAMGISIQQNSYAYANSPNDKYVIVVYNIGNYSSSILTNLYAGIFADWDIDDAGANKAGYDAARKMGYVYSMGTDSLFAAIKVLSNTTANNYSLDLDGSDVINPNGGGYTTNEKYTSLSTNRNTAGGANGGDVAHVVSSGGFSLAPGANVTVAFAIIAGDSLSDIQMSADSAQVRYDGDALTVAENEDKSDFSIYPNPTNENFTIVHNLKGKNHVLKIVDLLGTTVYSENLNTNQNEVPVNIAQLANGIYLVVLSNTETNEQTVRKLVIQQ